LTNFSVATASISPIAQWHGNVYIADRENHPIQKFDANGSYLAQWGQTTATGLSNKVEPING